MLFLTGDESAIVDRLLRLRECYRTLGMETMKEGGKGEKMWWYSLIVAGSTVPFVFGFPVSSQPDGESLRSPFL